MGLVDGLRRTLLTVLVGVPVVLVLVDGMLRGLDAREENAVVAFVRDAAELVTPEVLTTVFEDQAHWQTVFVALVAYGLLLLAILVIFALIERAVLAVTSRGDRERERGR